MNDQSLIDWCEGDLDFMSIGNTHRECAVLDIIESIQPPSHEPDYGQDFTSAQGFFGIGVVVHLKAAVENVQRIRFHFRNSLP